MANYYGITRTNYFSVTNPDHLKEMIGKVAAAEDDVELFDCEIDGVLKYGFGCYSTISGYETTDEDGDFDYDYDAFIRDLQEILAPGDAIVITEIGNEKLRYLCAASLIITKEAIKSVVLHDVVGEMLRELMGDDSFRTTHDY